MGQQGVKAFLVVCQTEIDRVVKVRYVTVLTMMTTSGAGTDSDNAMPAAEDRIFVFLSVCLSESMRAWLGSSFSKLPAPLQVRWDLTPAAQSGVFCSETLGIEYNS